MGREDGVRDDDDVLRMVTEDGHRAAGAGRALAAGRADSNLVELRPWDRPSPSGPWHRPRPLATDYRRPSWRP